LGFAFYRRIGLEASALSGDEISLTLPADEDFHGVAHLVLAGLVARLDLTVESLEDLELALDALLEQSSDGSDVTLQVRVLDGALQTLVGPFTAVGAALESDGDGSLDLRRILSTVTDDVQVVDRDGSEWVQLTKRVETRGDVT
jgi:hypothetical protein